MADTAPKLWGGRFNLPTEALVESYTASINVDVRLYRFDIEASKVHCRMLGRQGILALEESEAIVAGLDQVEKEIDEGRLPFSNTLEDIHMHVEHRLKELIGPVAGKLHTARSRNDQVATDLRLYLRDATDHLLCSLDLLKLSLVELAEKHSHTIMPGFTHLQIAQPVTLAHHLLAYFEMLDRDCGRLHDMRRRMNVSPLGSAALAGTPHPIDRHWCAQELGFDGICANSLDAVADRDFALELVFACSVLMMHLSRLSEELILWSTPAFGFIELSDAYCTGSSIMPQKKNPDVAELARGKTGRVYGQLMSLLTLMKGLPLAYNRDMQEDKEPVFTAIDTTQDTVRVFIGMLSTLAVKKEKMATAAGQGYSTATDLADYLVRKEVPFREAHEVVGKIVRLAVDSQRTLDQLTLDEMQAIHHAIQADVFAAITLESSLHARKATGGPAPATVRQAIKEAYQRLTPKQGNQA